MSLSITVTAMAAAGCTAEQIAEVVRAHEAQGEKRAETKREAARERQRRHRERAKESVTREERDDALQRVTSVTGVSPEVSPKDNNQTPFLPPSPECDTRASRSSLTGAELAAKANEFYNAYPKKIDPTDAKAKFIQIVKSGVDPDRIIAAAGKFAEAHRIAGTEKQFIRAPAVWLNKGGYDSEDLPEPPRAPPQRAGPPPHQKAAVSAALQVALEFADANAHEDKYSESSREASVPDEPGGRGGAVLWIAGSR